MKSVRPWQHEHVFLGESHRRNERRIWIVIALTVTMMIAEIVGGSLLGSMAVFADGWHMATHAAALGVAALAYRFAREHAHDERFTFGTGKLGELAGFTSAVILALIALLIGYESALRLYSPVPIRFEEAIVVAAVGLGVNLLSAWLLFDSHEHTHAHAAPDHGHHHADHDTNFRAAYSHVLADALTSVLALVALIGGRSYGWTWLDPVVGIVGAIVIARWSWRLIRSAAAVLLDTVPNAGLVEHIREHLEVGDDRVADLHLWRLGPGHSGVIASVVSTDPQPPETYKRRLADFEGLSHVTIEVQRCEPRQAA